MKLFSPILLFAIVFAVVLNSDSIAETKTWTPFFGGADWNSDLNWNPTGEPTTNDDVIISLANDQVLLTSNSGFVNSLLLNNGADLATNGSTLVVDDATESATMTIGNNVGLSRLEIDAGGSKAADIDRLVINGGGQLDMDGGLIEIDTFLDANTGAEIVGRGTIELAGSDAGGRAAILDGTIIVEPAQTMTFRSTGGGSIDLDGGSGATSVNVLDGASLVIDGRISDPFDGQIDLNHGSRLEVTQPWRLAGSLVNNANAIDGIPLEVATIDGAEITVTGTLDIQDQGQVTINAPAVFQSTTVLVDDDASNDNPNPLLLLNGPVTWSDTLVRGNGNIRFADPVEFTGESSISVNAFVDNNVTGPGDLFVRPNARVSFFDAVGGLSEARIDVEQNAHLGILPQVGSFNHESIIELFDGAVLRLGDSTLDGTLAVESGEASVSLAGSVLIGTAGSGFSIISGSGNTLRFLQSFSNGITEYGSNVAVLGSPRIIHDSRVRIRPGTGVDLTGALLEIAEGDASEATLTVDGQFFTDITTLAAGVDSLAVANIQTRWQVNDSLYVGGSTTTLGGIATLDMVRLPVGGTPRLEVANELRVYDGSNIVLDGGHLTAEFLLMDPGAALSFLDGSITVAGGAGTLPGTSLAFGTQAGDQPEFFVTDGADVTVQFAWRMATTVDGNARTEVTGKSPINIPSKLRNTGGGGGADLVVGQAGIAELIVSGGGIVDFSDDILLGEQATAVGTAEVDGVASGLRSTLRTRGGGGSVIYVGRFGGGSLDVTDGALVSSAGDIVIAEQTNSSGQLHLFQTGSPDNGGFSSEAITADDLFVGGSGFGNLLVDTGGRVQVGDALIVNNALSRLELNGGLFQAGRFVHTAGGTVSLNFGRGELTGVGTTVSTPLVIGDGVSTPMELVVESGGTASFGETTIEANGVFEIAGQADIGELAIAAGGTLHVSGRVDIDKLNSSGGTYALAGGTLAITQTQFSTINNPLTVQSTSSIEIPGGSTLLYGGNVSGNGGAETLVVTGGGELALRGTTTLGGSLVIDSGTLFSDADSLPTVIQNNAELIFQQVAFDNYAGTISGGGSLTKTSPGTLVLTQNHTYTGDTVVEEGTLILSQAFLNDAADVVVDSSATLSLTHNATDTIGSLILDGLSRGLGTHGAIGSGADFEWSQITGTGILEVTTFGGLAGDYNGNGIVDLADYSVWRNNLGAPAGTLANDPNAGAIGSLQYVTWKENFGTSMPTSGSLSNTTVPEPTTYVLCGIFPVLLFGLGQRSRLYCLITQR